MDFTLLRPSRVYNLLEGHPDRPSKRTVNRWCAGGAVPNWVEEIVRQRLETREAAPPQWVERLKGELIAEIRMNREVITEAMIGRTQELVTEMDRLLGELAKRSRPPDGDPPLNGENQDAGAGTPQPAKE